MNPRIVVWILIVPVVVFILIEAILLS